MPYNPSSGDGLRLDFDNGMGIKRTVYAKHRPLGIRYAHTLPIVAEAFSFNSYAQQELGVERGWVLTQIHDTNVEGKTDFTEVNQMLLGRLAVFPVYPLRIDFENPKSKKKLV